MSQVLYEQNLVVVKTSLHHIFNMLSSGRPTTFKFTPDPFKLAPLVFLAKAASQYATIASVLIVLQGLFTHIQSVNLQRTENITPTSRCKFRSNKYVMYNRAGFVILQAKEQHGVRRLQKLNRAVRRQA